MQITFSLSQCYPIAALNAPSMPDAILFQSVHKIISSPQLFSNSSTSCQGIFTQPIHLPTYIHIICHYKFAPFSSASQSYDAFLHSFLTRPATVQRFAGRQASLKPTWVSFPPKKKDTDFLVSRRSDPPPALENAPISDVIFPNDDYPPGFPCTSGCGRKFHTVIQQEIHTQHYCERPYDPIESSQGASVTAPQTPSAMSVSDRDRIVGWLASSGISSLDPNPPSSPSPVAVALNHNKEFASGTSNLEPNPPSTLTVDDVAVNHNKRFECSICGKCVTKQWVLNGHMKLHAAGKLPCPVNGCKYHEAKSWADLDFHLRVDHHLRVDEADITEQGGGARFTCWYCGRNMNKRSLLKRHTRKHEAGKFPCPVDNCSSNVLQTQDALDQHLQMLHANEQISGSLL